MIGLDTTAIIDFFRGEEKLKTILQEPIATTSLNYLEIQFGIDYDDKKRDQEIRYYEEFFNNTHHIELNKAIAKRASHIVWQLRKQGKTIGKIDATIAAGYLEYGITTILTRNKKHFENIQGLQVISY